MLEVIEDVPLLYWLNDIYRVAGLVEVWVGIGVGGLGIGDWILQGGFGDDVVGFVDGFVIWRRIFLFLCGFGYLSKSSLFNEIKFGKFNKDNYFLK